MNLQSVSAARLVQIEGLLARAAYNEIDSLAKPTTATFSPDIIQGLIEKCVREFEGADVSNADSWLAPRLHAGLRMSRRTAADTGMWTWLAAGIARKYVEWRFPQSEESSWWRYTSTDLMRNALSRLWWGAEMTRSGADYSVTELAFSRVRTFMFVSELQYSWHREATRAFARVISDCDAHSNKEPDNLSKLFNVYLRTQSLECWDPFDWSFQQSGPEPEWITGRVSLGDLLVPTDKLDGPRSGVSDMKAEKRLYEWLTTMLQEFRQNQGK